MNVFHAARMNGSFERKKRFVDRIKRNRTEFFTGRGSGKRLVMVQAMKSGSTIDREKVLFTAIFAMLNCLTSCVVLYDV